MVNRLEFTDKVKEQMFRRAGGPGNVCCEGCGLPLNGKPFEYDHCIEEWEREDIQYGLRPPLTAEDGKLLCIPCHDAKTGKKAGERAHGKRIVRKAAKAHKPKRGGFSKRFSHKMNGDVVDRETGEIVRRGRNG